MLRILAVATTLWAFGPFSFSALFFTFVFDFTQFFFEIVRPEDPLYMKSAENTWFDFWTSKLSIFYRFEKKKAPSSNLSIHKK